MRFIVCCDHASLIVEAEDWRAAMRKLDCHACHWVHYGSPVFRDVRVYTYEEEHHEQSMGS